MCNDIKNDNFDYQSPPDIIDDEDVKLILQYGMDSYYVEPWFECKIEQRFNDNLKGFIHGMNTTYSVYRDAAASFVNVGPYQLSGKYTDLCYF